MTSTAPTTSHSSTSFTPSAAAAFVESPSMPPSAAASVSSLVPTAHSPHSLNNSSSNNSDPGDNVIRSGIMVALIVMFVTLCVVLVLFQWGLLPMTCCWKENRRRRRTSRRDWQRQQQNHESTPHEQWQAMDERNRNAIAAAATSRALTSTAAADDDHYDDEWERKKMQVLQWLESVHLVLKEENFLQDRSPPHDDENEQQQTQKQQQCWRGSTTIGNDVVDDDDAAPRPSPIVDKNDVIRIPVPGSMMMNRNHNRTSEVVPRRRVNNRTADHGDVGALDGSERDDETLAPTTPTSTTAATSLSPPIHLRYASGTCTICLLNYQVGDSVTWSTNTECEHCFHTNCIRSWVLQRMRQLQPNGRSSRRRRRRHAESALPGRTRNESEVDDGDDDYDSYALPRCPNCRRVFVTNPYEIRA